MQEYKAEQENIFPHSMKHAYNIAEYNYFKEWMESIGNKKVRYFLSMMDAYMKKMFKMESN